MKRSEIKNHRVYQGVTGEKRLVVSIDRDPRMSYTDHVVTWVGEDDDSLEGTCLLGSFARWAVAATGAKVEFEA
jgi:hypothetical protein